VYQESRHVPDFLAQLGTGDTGRQRAIDPSLQLATDRFEEY